jgi:acyl-coenzyme A synthetase/AMP-(fatty) acid ligase
MAAMIVGRVYEWARVEPSRPALIHNGVVNDYATFAGRIEAAREFLKRRDLPAGTIAVVLADSLADAWVLILALRTLGLTTVNARSLAQAKALDIKNLSCVVTDAPPRSFRSVFGLLAGLRVSAAETRQMLGARLVSVPRRVLDAMPPRDPPPLPPGNGHYGGHIIYTSGTTGAFKKLMWDGDREDARIAARSRANGFTKSTVAHVLSYEQQTGIGWKIPLSVWQAGGCVVFDQRPDWRERFFEHDITITFAHPGSFQPLLDAENPRPGNCEVLLSSGFFGSELIAKAIARFDGRLGNFYGSTELITPPLNARIRTLDDAQWIEPDPDRTVQIIDDNGRECPPGVEGDLRIFTTDLDWQSYLDDKDATSRVFRDGFFYPGDRAVRRADGCIRILGRVADVLNVRGIKIAVAPLEQRIRQDLEVDEVCMFSGLNALGQEELVIAIQSDEEPPKQKLDSISREFEKFDKVRFSFLKRFPRTETGLEKVRRAELRKMVFPESGNQI